MGKMRLNDNQRAILELYLSDEELLRTEIADRVGVVNSTVTSTIQKYEAGVLPHPDNEGEIDIDYNLNNDDYRYIAQNMMNEGDRGLQIARKIINKLPDESVP